MTTRNDLRIRPASEADLPVLRQFEQDLIATERAFDPTLKPAGAVYYDLPALIAAPDVCLLVGAYEGEVVASGYVRIETSKPYLVHARHGYLGFMYVRPDRRGWGLNRLIMDALCDWARGRGVGELRLEVYHRNTAAIRAYEKAGFGAHMVEMRRTSGTTSDGRQA